MKVKGRHGRQAVAFAPLACRPRPRGQSCLQAEHVSGCAGSMPSENLKACRTRTRSCRVQRDVPCNMCLATCASWASTHRHSDHAMSAVQLTRCSTSSRAWLETAACSCMHTYRQIHTCMLSYIHTCMNNSVYVYHLLCRQCPHMYECVYHIVQRHFTTLWLEGLENGNSPRELCCRGPPWSLCSTNRLHRGPRPVGALQRSKEMPSFTLLRTLALGPGSP